MDIISIVSVIIAFCVLIVFIVVLVFQESDSKHKTPEEKMETLLSTLSYADVGNYGYGSEDTYYYYDH
jgi:hypothetical protein